MSWSWRGLGWLGGSHNAQSLSQCCSIGDIEVGVTSSSILADDTKLFREIESLQDSKGLQ